MDIKTYKQRDRQTDMIKLMVTFQNCLVNIPYQWHIYGTAGKSGINVDVGIVQDQAKRYHIHHCGKE
jgi:hypothetical protein